VGALVVDGGFYGSERDEDTAFVEEIEELYQPPWRWLESTRQLQAETYGYTFPMDDDALAWYVTWNHTAAVKELGEALDEVGWKPWGKRRGWIDRDAFITELVDAVHFIGNMAVAAGCTDEEWERRYRAKRTINQERQRDGYDGVGEKCPGCKRAYEDSTSTERIKTTIGCFPDWVATSGELLEQAYCYELHRFV